MSPAAVSAIDHGADRAGLPSAPSPAELWLNAREAMALLAVDPTLGLRLRARAGFVRDAWIDALRQIMPPRAPILRLPANVAGAALTGGLDLAASLAAGRPVAETGLLARADGGLILAAMAERMSGEIGAILAAALDTGRIPVEREGLSLERSARFGLVALDEGVDSDEAPPQGVCERLALCVDLEGADPREVEANRKASAGHVAAATSADASEHRVVSAARARLPRVTADDRMVALIVRTADALGIVSVRASIQALAVARAAAALAGSDSVDDAAFEVAVRHVLLPRATRIPQPLTEASEQNVEDSDGDRDDAERRETEKTQQEDGNRDDIDMPAEPSSPEEVDVGTASVELPADLLARLAAMVRPALSLRMSGRTGAASRSARRGRIVGTRMGDPRRDRIDLTATLTAAAPWQPLRRRQIDGSTVSFPSSQSRSLGNPPPRMLIRADDIRVRRLKAKSETATIFCVDASGSAALARLAEAKGAVELILAECYVRRDRVALLAFRGTKADVLLPETRSLTRAKRALSAFPGGGGTPLASGIAAALTLARTAEREGRTPLIALLTDGRANIAADGAANRARAGEDALAAAAGVRASGVRSLVVDVGLRPGPAVRSLADRMGGTYLALPRADSHALSTAVADAGAGRLPGARRDRAVDHDVSVGAAR